MRRRFNNLPQEIKLEIITRVPTESVLECKLVCKPWRDLVRLPSFSQMHLDRLRSADDDFGKLSFVFLNRDYLNLFCFSSDDDDDDDNSVTREEYNMRHEFFYAEYDENSQETPFSRKVRLNINLPFDKSEYVFVGSCNGLICIDSWFSEIYEPTYIFNPINPITREYIILPTSEGDYWWTGFGYILSTNEYKVVRVYNPRGDSNVTSVYVYTLGSSTGWRNVGAVDKDMRINRRTAGAFANGFLYWEDVSGNIFAFHLADEKFSKLPSLPCLTEADFCNYPVFTRVLGGFLSATYRSTAFVSEIWFLKKNNNDLSWSKEFSHNTYMSPPFGYTKSGRFLCYDQNKIYGIDTKASSGEMDLNFGQSIDGAISHKNTLVSLKALGEKDAKTMESVERAS